MLEDPLSGLHRLADNALSGAADYSKRDKYELFPADRRDHLPVAPVFPLLPVLDEFDAAVAASDGDAAKGLAMIRDNVLQVLRSAGLEEVATTGTFDPYLHEAVGHANDDTAAEGTIKEVVQKGYRFDFKLLRPAKVIVVRKGGES